MSPDAQTQTAKILCVDDEPSVLDALTRLLRKDFEVFSTTDPHRALELLREHPDFTIILTDYRMPELNGVELLKQARLIAPDTLRAILSGQIDLLDLSSAINSVEIHRFIMKPWNNDYLLVQMLESLQAHNTLRERNELRTLAITDPVTQLTNHRYFQQQIRQELELAQQSDQPLSLVMVDVDHFKGFNDRYGHPEGDLLLSLIAQRIQQKFPEVGSASRYGGEEFGIILPATTQDEALKKAEDLRKSLESNPFAGPYRRPAYVTISLGIASFPKNASCAEDLIIVADRALYQAKRQGRNQCVTAST